MKALVITYNGREIPGYVLDQIVVAISEDPTITGATAYRLDENDIVNAIVGKTLEGSLQANINKKCLPEDQEAIDKAATYIAESVLKHTKSPMHIGYLICKHIENGDTEMMTAIEILSTKKGTIHNSLFTKSILSAVKSIYESIKNNVL